MATIVRRPVVYYRNSYPFYYQNPIINNTCAQMTEQMEDNLVNKIQSMSVPFGRSAAIAKINELKADANAIQNQKASCNASIGAINPFINIPVVYRTAY